MRKRIARADGILRKTRRSRLHLHRQLQLHSSIIAWCFKERGNEALEQEAEAAEPAAGAEACLACLRVSVARGPMRTCVCGCTWTMFPWSFF